MLYLEDYLEMIEHLPAELRDRFTDIREMDLSVQNKVDSLEERQKSFFANCAKKLKADEREAEFEKIRAEYKKVVEEASDKIQVTEECYGLVDRYLRKLDEELHKFKMELEADNRGITEILEKHSLELDAVQPASLKENRLPKKLSKKSSVAGMQAKYDSRKPSSYSLNDMLPQMDSSPLGMSPAGAAAASGTSYALQHMGPGGNAIAQAASQAIAATQQLTGRRTSSLKASFEAINLGVQTHEFSIGRELAGAAQQAIASTSFGFPVAAGSSDSPPPTKKTKKSTKSTGLPAEQVLDVVCSHLLDDSLLGSNPATDDLLADGAGMAADAEWNCDPNEPRYCICNQVSYGDMVACDNEDCPYEWFHYPCVGVEAPPKGKWYCPTCHTNMARRKSRK